MATILVVDDEIGIRELLSEILADEGYDVKLAQNAGAARAARNAARPDLVLLDIWMPVVMMSGHGTIDTAVEATRIGALDFLEKPIAMQKLLAAVKRGMLRTPSTAPQELTLAAFQRAGELRDLRRRLEQIAAKSRLVLLKTLPGGFSELAARTLQAPGKPWVDLAEIGQPIDLAALESASGGILYVAELVQLSRLQQKNLSFASERLERFNLRLVAATTQPIDELRRAGWDEGLLMRLFEVWLPLPSLAELKDDVPELAVQLLGHLVESGEVPLRRLSTAALNLLRNQAWQGGWAELRSTLRSLAIAALDEEISGEEVVRLVGGAPSQASLALPLDLPLREAREAFERLYFEHHLRSDSANMTRLAERTGLERTHLYRKLKQLGLQAGRRAEESAGQ
jgi:DNA-binding NtrC family response regulator